MAGPAGGIPRFHLRVAAEVGLIVAREWQPWADCAKYLIIADSYKVVEAPDGTRFLVFTPRTADPLAKVNCHTYVSRMLPGISEVLGADDGIIGIPVCGTNPAKVVFDSATWLVGQVSSVATEMFEDGLRALPVREGDLLIWIGDAPLHTGLGWAGPPVFLHSARILAKGKAGWLCDHKMGEAAPATEPCADIAGRMATSVAPEPFDLEREQINPLAGLPLHIEVRRPIMSEKDGNGLAR
ncbi:MAG: hypothetical protein HYV03_08750 [Deltaproteobacteria bacterium]|nr:hypothetical protein [Deltaproteobacteria bacterium]